MKTRIGWLLVCAVVLITISVFMGSAPSAATALNATLTATPRAPTTASEYYDQGVDHLDAGEYEQAVEHLTRAIELDPVNAKAYLNRGLAYYRQVDYDQAIADYDEAIRIQPGDGDVHFNRGLAYLDQVTMRAPSPTSGCG